MQLSVSTQDASAVGHQDQKRQPIGVPDVLGAGSAAVAAWNVSGGRPAGAPQPAPGHELPPVWVERLADGPADAADQQRLRLRNPGGWQPNHPVGVEPCWVEQSTKPGRFAG